MKPNVPYGFQEDDLAREGMMFIGDKGTILCNFYGGDPKLVGLSDADMKRYSNVKAVRRPIMREDATEGTIRWLKYWIDDIKGISTGKSPGSFEYMRALTESYNLGAVSLMCNGRKLLYDANTRRITNDEEANKLLYRDTRKGWEFI